MLVTRRAPIGARHYLTRTCFVLILWRYDFKASLMSHPSLWTVLFILMSKNIIFNDCWKQICYLFSRRFKIKDIGRFSNHNRPTHNRNPIVLCFINETYKWEFKYNCLKYLYEILNVDSIYDRLLCWKYKCTLRQTASDETIIWTVDKAHKHKWVPFKL